ncbi:MAG: branched-chain-amino-acid transaminase [Elusimicrobia bacterium]|nr:branched-chain-amino-acid transaminase [Elusimicrobiota bacterium]
MGKYIYIDGEFFGRDEAKISVFDHGLLYGDGVFEGIRAYSGNIFKLEEHLERLYGSAKAISLKIKLSVKEMERAVVDTVLKNGLQDAYIRLVVTRGQGDLGLSPDKCKEPTIIIIADKITLYPEEFYNNGLRIITAATRRNIPEALNPRIKSLNYLNNIMAKIEANLADVPEALMLNNEGYVAECTGDNIFIISRKGKVHTPPPYLGTLTGITRSAIIDLCREKGLDVQETPFTLFEVYNAEECFLTGTAAEVIPVVNIDGRIIGRGKPGKITKELILGFRKLTKEVGTRINPKG